MADTQQVERLKRSITEWNAWRALSLGGANLNRANLRGAHLRGANLSRADLRGADLMGADLMGADLMGADFRTNPHVALGEAIPSSADLSGANLSRALLSRALLKGADLRGVRILEANLSGANLSGGADLSGAYLYKVDLRKADLSNANLMGAYLEEANLSGANLMGAKLMGANLSKAILSGTDLSKADLSGANLSEADLSATHLLDGAKFKEANLSGVNLSKANLNGADLSKAILDGVDLTETQKDAHTKLPSENMPPSPQPSASSADSMNWFGAGVLVGGSVINVTANFASIAQGIDVIERRWRERQAKRQQLSVQTAHPSQAPSSQPNPLQAPTSDIVTIGLRLKSGSNSSFVRFINDPEQLNIYRAAFQSPSASLQLLQVLLLKDDGATLLADITQGSPSSKQLEAFLHPTVIQPSQASSSTDWRTLIKKESKNALAAEATLAEILEGLAAIEAQWSKQQAKLQASGTQPPTIPPSQQTPYSPKDIVGIGLGYKVKVQKDLQWIWINYYADLSAKIKTLSDPKSSVPPVQVMFQKREGRVLAIAVIQSEKKPPPLNVILGYLEADPQEQDNPPSGG